MCAPRDWLRRRLHRALISYDDALLGDEERTLVTTAKHHDATTL
jgi:hypothetical protein